VRAVVLGAAVAGIGVSIYLTVVHADAGALVCSTSGVVNCERVLSSAYGTILGTPVPTSAAGILWFAVSAALALARRRDLLLAWSALGLLTVLYLVYVEIDRVGVICVWCTAAHALVLVTLVAVLTERYSAAGRAPARR
jgi:uncharacterized membrane protein